MALGFRSPRFPDRGKRHFQARTVELFKASTIEQKPAAEVAAAFQTSVGNVYQAKHSVLAKLRSVLEALDEGLDLDEAVARKLDT